MTIKKTTIKSKILVINLKYRKIINKKNKILFKSLKYKNPKTKKFKLLNKIK